MSCPGYHTARIPRLRVGAPVLAAIVGALAGCGSWERVPGPSPEAHAAFEVPEARIQASSAQAMREFQAAADPVYRLGPGDQIRLDVAARPEISDIHLVGPDGNITLPYAGEVTVAGLSREQAGRAIHERLVEFYPELFLTVGITKYGSNRIVVLGRVENPGVIQFDTPPTLLETLAQAGGLPLLRKEQLLTRAAVIRGDRILWVDVARLLTGDLSLNIQLQRSDIVYIPDAFDTPVYVLGAVANPGVYRLTPQMSFLDALGQAGGPTRDANLNRIHVIRPDERVHLTFALSRILKPDPTLNVALKEGDVIYVQHSAVAKIGYLLEKINPFTSLLLINQLVGGDD